MAVLVPIVGGGENVTPEVTEQTPKLEDLKEKALSIGKISIPTAENIDYDNASSDLTSTNVQSAIDEIDARVDTVEVGVEKVDEINTLIKNNIIGEDEEQGTFFIPVVNIFTTATGDTSSLIALPKEAEAQVRFDVEFIFSLTSFTVSIEGWLQKDLQTQFVAFVNQNFNSSIYFISDIFCGINETDGVINFLFQWNGIGEKKIIIKNLRVTNATSPKEKWVEIMSKSYDSSTVEIGKMRSIPIANQFEQIALLKNEIKELTKIQEYDESVLEDTNPSIEFRDCKFVKQGNIVHFAIHLLSTEGVEAQTETPIGVLPYNLRPYSMATNVIFVTAGFTNGMDIPLTNAHLFFKDDGYMSIFPPDHIGQMAEIFFSGTYICQ